MFDQFSEFCFFNLYLVVYRLKWVDQCIPRRKIAPSFNWNGLITLAMVGMIDLLFVSSGENKLYCKLYKNALLVSWLTLHSAGVSVQQVDVIALTNVGASFSFVFWQMVLEECRNRKRSMGKTLRILIPCLFCTAYLLSAAPWTLQLTADKIDMESRWD